MEGSGYKRDRTAEKTAEVEELWKINTNKESQIMAMLVYYTKLCLLHEQTWDNYKVKRLEYRELQSEITRHQKQSSGASEDHSTKTSGRLFAILQLGEAQ